MNHLLIHRRYILFSLYLLLQQDCVIYANGGFFSAIPHVNKVSFYAEDSVLLEGALHLHQYLSGQEGISKAISLETMVSNFYNGQNNSISDMGIESYDKFDGYESGDGILMESPLKYLPEKDSIKNVHAEWEINYSDLSKPCLSLKRILPIGISKHEAKKYEEHLAELYAKSGGKIAASWFTGHLLLYYCPRNLFGEWVSDIKVVLNIKDGVVLGQERERIRTGSMDRYIVKKQRANNGNRITLAGYNDGCWTYGSEYRAMALGLFVNDSLSIADRPDIQKEFSLLLFTDSTGVSSISVLQPKELGTDELGLITNLKKQIAKLPKWSFGWMTTINGNIFPGCYLKVIYSKEIGWEFQDYVCKSTDH